jgi:UPF0716 protein FxsA
VRSRVEGKGKEKFVLRRLPFIICAAVALDFLLWATLWCWLDWELVLVQTGTTVVLGLVVIYYYHRRWSELVARNFDSRSATVSAWSFEKLLLLVAGITLLIPGIVTDFLGLLLLVPGVRRGIVNLLQL